MKKLFVLFSLLVACTAIYGQDNRLIYSKNVRDADKRTMEILRASEAFVSVDLVGIDLEKIHVSDQFVLQFGVKNLSVQKEKIEERGVNNFIFVGKNKEDVGTSSPSTKLHVVGVSYFDGNVGIGTSSPTAPLHVAGNIRATGTIRANEVRVTSLGADFVFAPDYRLRPLAEVEQFITANKHLPDIAPAESMVQDGVDIGELQIQLLQKIEELTLYVIELKKEIEELKK